MVSHMKTTIQIADPLLEEAREIASREATTLRTLVEEGLRTVIERYKRKAPFHLRRASFQGNGLNPELRDASWEQLREAAYEGRGG